MKKNNIIAKIYFIISYALCFTAGLWFDAYITTKNVKSLLLTFLFLICALCFVFVSYMKKKSV